MLKPVLVFEKLDFQRTWFPLKAVEMKLDAYTTLILYGKHFYKAACKRSAQPRACLCVKWVNSVASRAVDQVSSGHVKIPGAGLRVRRRLDH